MSLFSGLVVLTEKQFCNFNLFAPFHNGSLVLKDRIFKHILLLIQFYNQHTNKYIQYTLRDWNGSQMLIEFLSLT